MADNMSALQERNERVKYAKSIGVEKPHTLKKEALEEAILEAENKRAWTTQTHTGHPVPPVDDDPIEETTGDEGDLDEDGDAIPVEEAIADAVSLRESIREAWLIDASNALNSIFRQKGYPQVDEVKVVVSTGFPSANVRKVIGQCHHASANDGIAHLFVSPVLDDSLDVLGVLAHEKVHSLGFTGHVKEFRTCAIAIGLKGVGGGKWREATPEDDPSIVKDVEDSEGNPAKGVWVPGTGFTSTVITDEEKATYEAIVEELGPYPHKKLNLGEKGGKKQPTRQIKLECSQEDEPCGVADDAGNPYQHYTSTKWIEIGFGKCICGQEMMIAPKKDARKRDKKAKEKTK